MNNNIIERLERIETKLDNVIKAMHDYDGDEDLHCEYSGLPSVKAYNEPQRGACSKHDEASWEEEEANKRMDVIGQNGNEGLHYDEGEFDDYGQRVVGNNNPAKHKGGNKKKYNNKYRRQPNTPVTPKKMGVVEHEQFRQPHKH